MTAAATAPPSPRPEDAPDWIPSVVSLSPAAIEELASELDEIYEATYDDLGEADERYIRGLIRLQRGLAFGSRALMMAALPFRKRGRTRTQAENVAFWGLTALGTAGLGLAKILENMEIGHNVMHGQWDWMNDPDINSTTWEWDNVCPADQWKHGHNVLHHTWTNVLGMDRDIGYEIFRVTPEQPWHPVHLFQPFYNVLLMLVFEYGVGVHEVDLDAINSGDPERIKGELPKLRGFAEKAARQMAKDYVLWPALAGPHMGMVAANNAVANVIRNVWSYMIIYCGHFPDDTHVFEKEQVAGETRGEWYLRQILGSANIEGGRTFNVLTGQLSHQIEHHLWPDMPSNRLPKVAHRVEALCERYGIPYNNAGLGRQFGTVVRKMWRYALPGG